MKHVYLALLSLTFLACNGNFDKRAIEKKILPTVQTKPTIEVTKDTFMGKNFFYVDNSFIDQIELKPDGTGTYVNEIGTSAINYTTSADFRIYTINLKSNLTLNEKTLKKIVIQVGATVKMTKTWLTLEGEDQIPKLKESEPVDKVQYAPRFALAHEIAAGDTIALPLKNNQSVILVKMVDESSGIVLDKGGQTLSDKFNWSLSENKNQLNLQFDKDLEVSYLKLADNKYTFVAVLDGKSIQMARSFKAAKTSALTEKSVIGEYAISGDNPTRRLIFEDEGVGGVINTGVKGFSQIWAWDLSEKRDAILIKTYLTADNESPVSKEELLKCVSSEIKCAVAQEKTYRLLQQDKQKFLFLKTTVKSDKSAASTMEELVKQ